MLLYIKNTWEFAKSADSTPRDARPLPDTDSAGGIQNLFFPYFLHGEITGS